MTTHHLEPFRLEEYLAKREFSSKFLFSSSDIDSRSIQDVLNLLPAAERQGFFDLNLGYTPTEGHAELRAEIASMHEAMRAENVLCFAGAEEAIYTAARVLLSPLNHAITINPCYQSLESVAKSICEVTSVDLEIVDGAWHLDFAKLARAIQPNTRVLFMNFPHNPTGYVPPRDLFEKIIGLARAHNIFVFSDEVYRGLELNPRDQLPSASEVYANALSLGVMSKSFGFGGLRIGWLTSQNTELLHRFNAYKHYLSICNSAPSEWLATAILRHREEILGENMELVRTNYALVKEYFKNRSDLFQWVEPKGGCIAYPRYLGKKSISTIADELLESRGVVILPDHVFGDSNQHFRVSFGRRNCAEALEQFGKFFP